MNFEVRCYTHLRWSCLAGSAPSRFIYCILSWIKFANLWFPANRRKYVPNKILWPFLPSPKGCQLLPPCFLHYHSQENGRPRKEDQKRKRPGRERKWVRRYLVHSVIIDAERLMETFVQNNFNIYVVGRGGPLLSLFCNSWGGAGSKFSLFCIVGALIVINIRSPNLPLQDIGIHATV